MPPNIGLPPNNVFPGGGGGGHKCFTNSLGRWTLLSYLLAMLQRRKNTFVFLYRLLRPHKEDFETAGLSAKDPFSTVSVNDHVAYGSRGYASSYISCSKSPEAVKDCV